MRYRFFNLYLLVSNVLETGAKPWFLFVLFWQGQGYGDVCMKVSKKGGTGSWQRKNE